MGFGMPHDPKTLAALRDSYAEQVAARKQYLAEQAEQPEQAPATREEER